MSKRISKMLFSKERVELALVDDIVKTYNKIKSDADSLSMTVRKAAQDVDKVANDATAVLKRIQATESDVQRIIKATNDLGVEIPSEAMVAIRQLEAYRSEMAELSQRADTASTGLFALLGQYMKKFETPSKTSPKGGRRGCLCKDETYSVKCCKGNIINQGIGKI